MRTPRDFLQRCRADGELGMAIRYWTGGLRLELDGEPDATLGWRVRDGALPDGDDATVPAAGEPGVLTLSADRAVWGELLAAVPRARFNDITPAQRRGLRRAGDELTYWQYLPALQRAIELLAEDPPPPSRPAPAEREAGATPRFDGPVGRYVHLALDGVDHRVYFEEVGQGIPVLLQHTAGSHGVQWRHLFEVPAITDRFRLIAYDLPYHGKSVPPVGIEWWTQRYQLFGSFLRSVPVQLASALGLERPVFMGCSVGGLLALDLALHHPEVFRAVISLEGALRVGGELESLIGFWHPGVSNESKARMMQGLTAPTAPMAYRKETIQTYASGWPPAFIGDLQYYVEEYDLRERAGDIDTERCAVHILNGEYDHSATPAHGRAAHEAIPGSTFTELVGMGHFPMSEDPERFVGYLLPILEQVAGRR